MNQRELFLRHVAQTSPLPLSGTDLDIVSAEGVTLTARDGKKYTDLISGISVSNIGHCHPEVIRAINEQSGKYMHLMVYGEFIQSPQVKYAHTLAQLLPPSLDCVYYTTGGSEAVEGAMKLAKRATGRNEIISFKNCYHGSTQGALSIMGSEFFRNSFRPLIPGCTLLDYNDLSQLEQITTRTAAVFAEPVQGEAGVVKANAQFMTALRERCTATGALLVFDEIQTGFGRTGHLFAFEGFDILPDVLVIAKGMGGGLPIGAFVASRQLMNLFTFDPVLGHINTFGGNAVCVAAAHATLKVILENKLWENAIQIEAIIKSELRHPLISGVRTAGALAAVDFGNEELNMKVIRECLSAGLITDWFLFCPTALRIAPPLTITPRELSASLTTLIRVLDNIN